MEELVTKHSTIMDRYDPNKRVALAVDEWGIRPFIHEVLVGKLHSFQYSFFLWQFLSIGSKNGDNCQEE